MPYVVETSIGLDRMFLAILSAAHQVEELEDGSTREVLRIPPLWPRESWPCCPEEGRTAGKTREIVDGLKLDHNCQYDEKDSIGRRYRRQDAIGTPYCITVDHETLKDGTVTIRDRDTMAQERGWPLPSAAHRLGKVHMHRLLRQL